MDEDSFEQILNKIDDVWNDYPDFEEGGLKYVAFIISEDLRDMAESDWEEEESMEEFIDIVINCLRIIDMRRESPAEEIMARLDNHQKKNPEKIIQKKDELYNEKYDRDFKVNY